MVTSAAEPEQHPTRGSSNSAEPSDGPRREHEALQLAGEALRHTPWPSDGPRATAMHGRIEIRPHASDSALDRYARLDTGRAESIVSARAEALDRHAHPHGGAPRSPTVEPSSSQSASAREHGWVDHGYGPPEEAGSPAGDGARGLHEASQLAGEALRHASPTRSEIRPLAMQGRVELIPHTSDSARRTGSVASGQAEVVDQHVIHGGAPRSPTGEPSSSRSTRAHEHGWADHDYGSQSDASALASRVHGTPQLGGHPLRHTSRPSNGHRSTAMHGRIKIRPYTGTSATGHSSAPEEQVERMMPRSPEPATTSALGEPSGAASLSMSTLAMRTTVLAPGADRDDIVRKTSDGERTESTTEGVSTPLSSAHIRLRPPVPSPAVERAVAAQLADGPRGDLSLRPLALDSKRAHGHSERDSGSDPVASRRPASHELLAPTRPRPESELVAFTRGSSRSLLGTTPAAAPGLTIEPVEQSGSAPRGRRNTVIETSSSLASEPAMLEPSTARSGDWAGDGATSVGAPLGPRTHTTIGREATRSREAPMAVYEPLQPITTASPPPLSPSFRTLETHDDGVVTPPRPTHSSARVDPLRVPDLAEPRAASLATHAGDDRRQGSLPSEPSRAVTVIPPEAFNPRAPHVSAWPLSTGDFDAASPTVPKPGGVATAPREHYPSTLSSQQAFASASAPPAHARVPPGPSAPLHPAPTPDASRIPSSALHPTGRSQAAPEARLVRSPGSTSLLPPATAAVGSAPAIVRTHATPSAARALPPFTSPAPAEPFHAPLPTAANPISAAPIGEDVLASIIATAARRQGIDV